MVVGLLSVAYGSGMEPTLIYGRHAVTEALRRRPEVVSRLIATPEALTDPVINKLARTVATVEPLGRRLPAGVSRDAVHQGLIAAIDTNQLLMPFKDFVATLKPTADTVLVLLGEVQDPQNVGSIIRSAGAFGARAVLIPKHRQASLTGSVIKVSAGLAFSVPLVAVGNVNTALRTLKEQGFWTYALAGDGAANVHEEHFDRPSVFVVGNEGSGVREKTQAVCDTTLHVPIHPRAESLNAAVSTAAVLTVWSGQHPNSTTA